jgi:hypothetical protein
MSNPATGRDNPHDHLLNYQGATFREESLIPNFSPAFSTIRISDVENRRFDIIDGERIRAEQEIMAEEDRNIFAAINSVSDQREQMKIEELRKSRKVVSSIFELEIE